MRKLWIRAVSLVAAMVVSLGPTAAWAGGLTVRVLDGRGHPVADAIVTLRPISQGAPAMRVSGPYRVEQRNTQFHPFISVVPVGATVSFPNFDPFKHHVYSFSTAKRFELRLFARDQSRSVTFERPGIVAVGCNIHDSMSAYIYVTDTAWTARADGSGTVSFRDTPTQAFSLAVWHPYLRAPGGVVFRRLDATAAGQTQTVTVQLRAPPMHAMGGY